MERSGSLTAALLLTFSCACTPSARGLCAQDADCKADEKCSSGLCIKLSVLEPGGGNPDAGNSDAGNSDAGNSDAGNSDAGNSDAGNSDAGCIGAACTASLTITSPVAGQLVGGTVHVVATVSASVAPSAISFSLGVSGGSELGTVVPTAAGRVYSGDIALTDKRAQGAATVSASMTIGGTLIAAAPVAISLDQALPGISGYSVLTPPDFQDAGTAWYRATGTAVQLKAQLAGSSPLDGGSIEVDWTANGSPGSASWDKSPQNAPPPWFFYVPRAAGAGVEGAQTFTLHVADILGHSNQQDLQVAFDDVAPSFLPALDLPATDTWVARVVTSGFNQQAISIGAVDQGTGVALVTAQPNGGTQVALGATAQPNVYSNTIDLSHAPSSFAGSYVIAIATQDQLGNSDAGTYSLLVDDVSPTIKPASDSSWYGIPGALTATPAVIVTDQGSGVANATFTLPGVTGSGASASGNLTQGDGLGGTWTASQPLTLPTAARETPLPIALQVSDAVGNVSSTAAAYTVNFDNVAPRLTGVTATTQVDAEYGGKSWYRGSSGGGGPITVNAVATDGNLDTTAANQPSITYPGAASPIAGKQTGPQVSGAYPYSFQVPRLGGVSAATSGTAYTIAARDLAANVTAPNPTLTLYFDDQPPTITPATDPLWYGGPGGLVVTPAVSIGDQASGVASATFSFGGASVSATLTAGTALSGTWSANKAITLPTAPRETPLQIALQATDGVGNPSSSAVAYTFNFDNVAPVVSNIVVTAPDATYAGKDWYRGAGGGGVDLEVSAKITDGNLDTGTANGPRITFLSYLPGAATQTSVPGTYKSDTLWHFPVPRLGGQNATSAGTTFTIVAKDLAGNVSAATGAQLTLYFDDAAQNSFSPRVVADNTWYSRKLGAGYSQLNVASTLAIPLSGVAALTLMSGPAVPAACTIATGACTLNAQNAPAGVEAAYPFTVVATSGVGVTSSGTGSRNFDDAAPVIDGTAKTPYPTVDFGPLGWSHDGSHFNLRDGGTLQLFTAYDCGAGLSRATPQYTVGGSPPGSTIAVNSISTMSCANGNVVPIYRYVIASAFTGVPRGTYPAADNLVPVGLTLADQATGTANTASSSVQVNVTRRLWQTSEVPAPGYTTLGLGPSRVLAVGAAGLVALDPSTGVPVNTLDATGSGPFAVASNGGASTAVAFAYDNATLRAINVLSGAVAGSCTLKDPTFSYTSYSFDGMVLRDPSTALAWSEGSHPDSSCSCPSSDCTAAQIKLCVLPSCGCGTPVGGASTFTEFTISASGSCTSVSSNIGHLPSSPAISANARLYSPGALATQPAAGGTVVTASGAIGSPLMLGSGPTSSTDSVYLFSTSNSLQRYDYSTGFALQWSVPGIALASVQPGSAGFLLARGSAGMQVLTLAGSLVGNPLPAGSGTVPPLIDGSPSPIAYFPDTTAAGLVQANLVGSGGIGGAPFTLPQLPGATTDLVLAGDGTLFATAGGRLSAIITDSTAAPAAGAWARRGKDACNSFNTGYTCPY